MGKSKEYIELRIAEKGRDKLPRLDCGWNLNLEQRLKIIGFINSFEPKNEVEVRDKHILELSFIKNMNSSTIQRLNDPLIICYGNRSKGKPLSSGSINKICYKYIPDLQQMIKQNREKKYKNKKDKTVRDELARLRERKFIHKPNICATCGTKSNLELHHIIPVSVGGTNEYYNLVMLCHDCHMKIHHELYKHLQKINED